MSLDARSSTRSARTATPAGVNRVRWASLAVLTLTLVEYGIGMYVNLYVTIPKADHRGSLTGAISNGPTTLSIHAAVGLLLGLAALGVLVQSIMARRGGVIVLSVLGLLALAFADVAGTGFTSTGDASASMAMSVL